MTEVAIAGQYESLFQKGMRKVNQACEYISNIKEQEYADGIAGVGHVKKFSCR